MVLFPDSEGLYAAVVTGVDLNLPQLAQWYFIFLPLHFFSKVLAPVMILPGPELFVEVCIYYMFQAGKLSSVATV